MTTEETTMTCQMKRKDTNKVMTMNSLNLNNNNNHNSSNIGRLHPHLNRSMLCRTRDQLKVVRAVPSTTASRCARPSLPLPSSIAWQNVGKGVHKSGNSFQIKVSFVKNSTPVAGKICNGWSVK